MTSADRDKRAALIRKLERARDSKVLCYLTSQRQNVPAHMSEDAVREVLGFLLKISKRPIKRLDLFLCSNGGDSVVPWRLVALFREYAKEFNVLIPYRAYSAATILSLGADSIVMHPFAALGPIDPTVSNEFNPVEQGTNRKLDVSVEDVKAYINFVKSTVGITHEDELVKALELLATHVHPLALGNVERFISQSRMMGRKIMETHMKDSNSSHVINEIVENLASKLYFHGHPINRKEAKDQLQLKVVEPSQTIERLMWELYEEYETFFGARMPFSPLIQINQKKAALAAAGTALPVPFVETVELRHAVLEDASMLRWFQTTRTYTEGMVNGPAGPQTFLKEELSFEGWTN